MQFTLGVILGAAVLSIYLWVVGFFDPKHTYNDYISFPEFEPLNCPPVKIPKPEPKRRVADYTVHLLDSSPQTVQASNAIVEDGLLFLQDAEGEDAGIFNLRLVLFVHATEITPAS